MRSRELLVALVVSVLAGVPARGQAAAPAATSAAAAIAAVWSLEEDYWRYVKAGDVENYVTLWHDDTYPDGRVEGRGKRSKITHTWKQVGDHWLIIGGMCGNVSDTAT